MSRLPWLSTGVVSFAAELVRYRALQDLTTPYHSRAAKGVLVGHGIGGFLALQYFVEYTKHAAKRLGDSGKSSQVCYPLQSWHPPCFIVPKPSTLAIMPSIALCQSPVGMPSVTLNALLLQTLLDYRFAIHCFVSICGGFAFWILYLEFWILDLDFGFCIYFVFADGFGGYLITFPTHADPGWRIQESGCQKL